MLDAFVIASPRPGLSRLHPSLTEASVSKARTWKRTWAERGLGWGIEIGIISDWFIFHCRCVCICDVLGRDYRSFSRHHDQQLHTTSDPLIGTFIETEEGESNGRDWGFEALIAEKNWKSEATQTKREGDMHSWGLLWGSGPQYNCYKNIFLQVLHNYMFLKKRKDKDIPSKFLEMGADTCLQFVPNIT